MGWPQMMTSIWQCMWHECECLCSVKHVQTFLEPHCGSNLCMSQLFSRAPQDHHEMIRCSNTSSYLLAGVARSSSSSSFLMSFLFPPPSEIAHGRSTAVPTATAQKRCATELHGVSRDFFQTRSQWAVEIHWHATCTSCFEEKFEALVQHDSW